MVIIGQVPQFCCKHFFFHVFDTCDKSKLKSSFSANNREAAITCKSCVGFWRTLEADSFERKCPKRGTSCLVENNKEPW